MEDSKKIVIERVTSHNWYSLPPLPEEWGLTGKQFKLKEQSIQSLETYNVGPADVVITTYSLLAAGAGVLSAAVSGIFAYLSSKGRGTIVIEGANGAKVEVPAGTSKDELDYYIKKAKDLDAHKITVIE